MNAPEAFLADTAALPDVQSVPDTRRLPIQQVGVKGVRHPVRIVTSRGQAQPSVATFDLYVALPAEVKGTHMSRFVELLQAWGERGLDLAGLRLMFHDMLRRLDAEQGRISVRFTYFVSKLAPVSAVPSLLDYEAQWEIEGRIDEPARVVQTVQVPVTSLCPCSREISAYGAHNQRSHLTLGVELASDMALEELIRVAETSASCELWGLLKRPDEKYVTERAYENPKFVEDLVRDVALRLRDDARVSAFSVDSENFESIHNHSAYARIEHRRDAR